MGPTTSMTIAGTALELVEGDLTELETEAIVNAANAQLVLGGGVAGAIARKGGPAIQEACSRHGPIRVGEAALTGGGRLRARYVVHAVGPRLGEGDEDEKLARATRSALELAEGHGVRTIAFPAISTGIFGYPMDRCAEVMLGTIIAYLQPGAKLDRVVVCLRGREALDAFREELSRHRVDPS